MYGCGHVRSGALMRLRERAVLGMGTDRVSRAVDRVSEGCGVPLVQGE